MSRLVTKPLSRYSAYYDPLNLPNHGLPSRTDEKLQGDRSSASLKACSTPVPSRISRWLHGSKKNPHIISWLKDAQRRTIFSPSTTGLATEGCRCLGSDACLTQLSRPQKGRLSV